MSRSNAVQARRSLEGYVRRRGAIAAADEVINVASARS
jgi:hypothetical protein